MTNAADPTQALREALRVSPDNMPLRRLLARTLFGLGRYEEAEEQYCRALQFAKKDRDCMIGLAETYLEQGKVSAALVVAEELLALPAAPGAVHVLHARILLRGGKPAQAVEAYRRGIQLDPAAADEDLAGRLGVDQEQPTEVVDGRLRAQVDEVLEQSSSGIERPKIDFSSVGGMEALKEEIRLKIIYPLNNKDLYAAYGKTMGGGILMYGPPGCGKTHLARATAGEIKAGFLSIGLHDVLDMWIGQSEQKLHQIFEQARQNTPCVLFFDEVDALGASRRDMRHSAGRNLINQFLSELDGVDGNNEGVLVLAATNAPWHLDPAFRRPGRFDRILFVPPPDEVARQAVLEILLQGKPQEKIDFAACARKTADFSGADLKGLVDVTVEAKLQEAMKRGIPSPIVTKDILAALKQVKPSTTEWFATARNYALFSNEGGAYDDILKHLGIRR